MDLEKQRMIDAARTVVADTKALSLSIHRLGEAVASSQNSFDDLSGAVRGVYDSSADPAYRNAVLVTTVGVGESMRAMVRSVSAILVEPEETSPVWNRLEESLASIAKNIQELVEMKPGHVEDLAIKELGDVVEETQKVAVLLVNCVMDPLKVPEEGNIIEMAKNLGLCTRRLMDLATSACAAILSQPVIAPEASCEMIRTASKSIQGSAAALLGVVKENKPGSAKLCDAAREVIIENLDKIRVGLKKLREERVACEDLRSGINSLRAFAPPVEKGLPDLQNLGTSISSLAVACADFLESAKNSDNSSETARTAIDSTGAVLKQMNELVHSASNEGMMDTLTSASKCVKSAVVSLIMLVKSSIESGSLFSDDMIAAPRLVSDALSSACEAGVQHVLEKKAALARENGEPPEDDLWTETEDDFQTQTVVVNASERPAVTASLNKLITRLTSAIHHDMKFTKAFITTHRSFTTPAVFLEKIMQRYNVPLEMEEQYKSKKKIGLRVCNVLRIWMDCQFSDFTRAMIGQCQDWLADRKEQEDLPAVVIDQLKKQLDSSVRARENKRKSVLLSPKLSKARFEITGSVLSWAAFLNDIDVDELATAMTLADFAIYLTIKPIELLNQSWNKPHLKHLAPNVLSLIARFNLISLWVSSIIIDAPTVRDRAKVITKLIKVADSLRRLNNFQTLTGLLGGLDSAPIYRLKHTWAEVKKPVTTMQRELMDIVSPDKSYGAFRALIHQVNPPALPYIGVYLKDLVFIEDGNPDKIRGLINFTKREFIYDVILEIQQYQQARYEQTVSPAMESYVESPPHHDGETLYKMSIEVEPRGASRVQVK